MRLPTMRINPDTVNERAVCVCESSWLTCGGHFPTETQSHRVTEKTNILAKPRYPKWFLLGFRFSLGLGDSAVKCSVGWDDAFDGGFQFV
jgi:hypothetical protein